MKGDLDALFQEIQPKRCISLVGAGGKTSLMQVLGDRLASAGRRVILTTTTHIQKLEHRPLAQSLEQAAALLDRFSPVVYGAPEENGKLTVPADWDLERVMQTADHVLIEADGAKCHPCKVPRAHEPVLPAGTDLVIGVMGLSCLSKSLSSACFGMKEAQRLLHATSDHPLNVYDLSAILSSPAGTRKAVGSRPFLIVLNQCDVEGGWRAAHELQTLLPSELVFSLSLRDISRKEQ